MKCSTRSWGALVLLFAALAGCGGGGGGEAVSPPSSDALTRAIAAAAAVPSNDTSTNQTAPFAVLQGAGVPAAAVGSPLKINFTVFSDGAVKSGLTLADMSFAVARVVAGTDGEPATWLNYVARTVTATAGPGGASDPPASAQQATTDPKASEAQLVYNSAGYYTYTFSADITNPDWQAMIGGVNYSTRGEFVPGATQRVSIQLSYKNAAGELVRVNPYFDFTFVSDGKGGYVSAPLVDPATQDLQVSVVSSCNTCHEALAQHGGGMVATQYCVMCHNPGTIDPDSGNVLTFSTMTHKIHAGQLLAGAPGGEDYMIWGYRGIKFDYSNVGYPQDMRNCANCHSSSNPATPQGDNWQTVVSKGTCLTCHANGSGSGWQLSHLGFANVIVGPGADPNTIPNAACASCHAAGGSLSAAVVHWPQIQVNQALYKMNIESAVFNDTPDRTGRTVTVTYTLTNPTDGDKPYRLLVNAVDCTANADGSLANCNEAMFGNLRAYLAYQNMIGQSSVVTEFSAYNNGGNVAFACLYEGPATTACPKTAVNDGSNRYTATIPLPDDTATQVAFGTAMVVTVGQIKELKLQTKWSGPDRPPVTPPVRVNTAVQHTSTQLALSGTLQPRRAIVSDEKCNVCHAVLGTASGSNTMPNAFHRGARNTWQSCTLCHDANLASATVATSGQQLNESYQFKRMIHGIHGNSKRFYPFTNGNAVVWPFCNPANTSAAAQAACNPAQSLAPDVTDFAATSLWPGVGLNCDACHVNNSWQTDQSTLGAAVLKYGDSAGGPVVFGGQTLVTNRWSWNVITPQAATCTSCHDSQAAIDHMIGAGAAHFGSITQAQSSQVLETCADCHSVGRPLGVDIVHGLK